MQSTTRMGYRDMMWTNVIRKMAVIDLLNPGLPQTFNFFFLKKQYPQSAIKQSPIKQAMPVLRDVGNWSYIKTKQYNLLYDDLALLSPFVIKVALGFLLMKELVKMRETKEHVYCSRLVTVDLLLYTEHKALFPWTIFCSGNSFTS